LAAPSWDVEVGGYDDWGGSSDHMPLIVDLEM